MAGKLNGKVAVVTGAGTGIGRETAKLYAEEGAKVVVADVRPADAEQTVKMIADAGGDAVFIATDVTIRDQVEALIRETESHYGALHVMTANAGTLGPGHLKSIEEITEAEIDRSMSVNFMGVVHAFKYATPAIRRAGGGAMTATASLAAHRGYANMAAYCAAKAAVVGLVQALGAELLPEIRVNAISPGAVDTQIAAHTTEESGRPTPAPRSLEAPYTRLGQPRELAQAHLWLVSDDASFVNGQTLCVDMGRSIVPA